MTAGMRHYALYPDPEDDAQVVVVCGWTPQPDPADIVAVVPAGYGTLVKRAVENAYRLGRRDMAEAIGAAVQEERLRT